MSHFLAGFAVGLIAAVAESLFLLLIVWGERWSVRSADDRW